MVKLDRIVATTSRMIANKRYLHNGGFRHAALRLNRLFIFNKGKEQFFRSTYTVHCNFCTSNKKMENFITSKFFVNGQWKEAKNTFPVLNPYSNKLIANAADCTQSDVEDAIGHASCAFKKWKKTTGKVSLLVSSQFLYIQYFWFNCYVTI